MGTCRIRKIMKIEFAKKLNFNFNTETLSSNMFTPSDLYITILIKPSLINLSRSDYDDIQSELKKIKRVMFKAPRINNIVNKPTLIANLFFNKEDRKILVGIQKKYGLIKKSSFVFGFIKEDKTKSYNQRMVELENVIKNIFLTITNVYEFVDEDKSCLSISNHSVERIIV